MSTRFLRLAYSAAVEDIGRQLDPLTVEAALNGRRTYWSLTAAEVAEVLRILHRRGSSLEFVSWLLDVDRHVIAERYTSASGAR